MRSSGLIFSLSGESIGSLADSPFVSVRLTSVPHLRGAIPVVRPEGFSVGDDAG